jgi:hypothetical protein
MRPDVKEDNVFAFWLVAVITVMVVAVTVEDLGGGGDLSDH